VPGGESGLPWVPVAAMWVYTSSGIRILSPQTGHLFQSVLPESRFLMMQYEHILWVHRNVTSAEVPERKKNKKKSTLTKKGGRECKKEQ